MNILEQSGLTWILVKNKFISVYDVVADIKKRAQMNEL